MPSGRVKISSVDLAKITNCEQLFNGTGSRVAYIGGYPLDVAYFAPYKSEIHHQFTPYPAISSKVDMFLKGVAAKQKGKSKVFVGIHVRRTDYMIWLAKRVKGKLASALYFSAAIAWFEKKYGRENTIFVVATDDYKWSHNVFKGLRNVAFASNAPQQLRLCSYIL